MSNYPRLLPALLATLLPATSYSMTADEIVARNLAARGGAALEAIQSLRMVGKLVFPGDFELAFNEVKSRSGGVRIEGTLQGLTFVQAYDGKEGWQIQPFEGRKDPARMSDDEARSLADEALIDGYLLAAQRGKGDTVLSLGTEDVDGTQAYKLRLTQADGDEFTYYIDPDSFLEIKIVEKRRLRGAELQTEYELGDYEKIAGAYFPMSIDSGPVGSSQRQKINIDKAEANVALDAALFHMPAAK